MTSEIPPSFSPARKWSLSVNTLVLFVTMLALLLMVNYLAARHFQRWACSGNAQAQLSPLTLRVLNSVTNPVKVTLYFDKRDPLYGMSYNLLKAYRFANRHIQVEVVDYLDEPGAAQLVKSTYKLGDTDRDIVIFYTQGRQRVVYQSELSDVDIQPLVSGQSRELKRTHFKGEAMFTSAILNILQSRQPKAYFLKGHNEHNPEADDAEGYSRFADVLRENNVVIDTLPLDGSGEIPADCNLLVVAGPRSPLHPDVLDKINRYLKQGGRLFVLFNYNSLLRATGLESLLADWGVEVGRNVVIDEVSHDSKDPHNMVTSAFSTHALVRPVYNYQLYFVLPRAVDKDRKRTAGSDAPQVDPLVYSSKGGRVITDIRRDGTMHGSVGDPTGNVSIAVAVEKGGVRNVTPDRGTTRIVVTGDSLFLNNNNIDREANRPFASHAINWLLARNELLVGVPRRPIEEFKLTLTAPEMSAVQWILMGALPGVALLLGGLVWLRRRR